MGLARTIPLDAPIPAPRPELRCCCGDRVQAHPTAAGCWYYHRPNAKHPRATGHAHAPDGAPWPVGARR